jgi:hydrocephalus-inducing protein
VQSVVSVDRPLFQPFPPEVVFHSYEPFKEYSTTLRLRNNDKVRPDHWGCCSRPAQHGTTQCAEPQLSPLCSPAPHLQTKQVARHVGVEHLASSFFKVQRLQPAGSAAAAIAGSKLAAGMEASFRVTFTPDSNSSYKQQLVVSTERERFLVPLLAVGAAAALDLPDSIALPGVAAGKASKRTLLVRNVGRAAGSFQLSVSAGGGCFAVTPAHGQLAPGEMLQLTVEFTPTRLGLHEGELEVTYASSSRSSLTALQGQGLALDVGASVDAQQRLLLPKTFMGKLSQRSFKIHNRSGTAVSWGVMAQPSADAEAAVASSALLAAQQLGRVAGGSCSITGTLPLACHSATGSSSSSGEASGDWHGADACGRISSHRISISSGGGSSAVGSSSGKQQQGGERRATSSSDCDTASLASDTSLLADGVLAALRATARVRRDICADRQLFASPHFTVFPPEGCVQPNSEGEVIVQFSPDCAGEFEARAWLDIQGLGERLPLLLRGEGLGPVVIFSYGDVLDIGEAFVNTEQAYELTLLNRSKVPASWELQHSHTRMGSKFAFSPDSGLLAPGGAQLIRVRLLADCLGRLDETFHVRLQGCAKPVSITIRGEVVGPQFSLDAQQLDYGVTSFGFRCEAVTFGRCCWPCSTLRPALGLLPLLLSSQVHAAADAHQHGRHPPGLCLAHGGGRQPGGARLYGVASERHRAAAGHADGGH